jgi:hypothetical protein
MKTTADKVKCIFCLQHEEAQKLKTAMTEREQNLKQENQNLRTTMTETMRRFEENYAEWVC